MGKVMQRVFMVFIVFVLVLGIAMVILGNAQQRLMNDAVNQQYRVRENTLNNIAKAYVSSGVGDDLKEAVAHYLQQIPEETRKDNNIVLLDENGSILYRYNDQYLRAGATKFSLFFYEYIGAIVYGADEYDVFNSCNTYGLSSYSGASFFGDGTMTIEAVEKLRKELQMLSEKGNVTQNQITIVEGDLQNRKFMLLWLYNDDVTSSIYNAMNRDYPWGLWSGLINAGAILILAYWLLLPVWVFLDARHKKTPPLPWALLVLVTNIVGLIVYWIVQNQTGKAPATAGPACPACGKPVQEEHPYCPWCATPLHKNCAACGKPLERGWVACPWCGKSCGD